MTVNYSSSHVRNLGWQIRILRLGDGKSPRGTAALCRLRARRDGLEPRELRLLETMAFSSGVVLLRYAAR